MQGWLAGWQAGWIGDGGVGMGALKGPRMDSGRDV